jgi:hypothetical protein
MSSERIRIDLERVDDAWRARLSAAEPDNGLVGTEREGDGPADVLEQVGQELDMLEVARISRERGIDTTPDHEPSPDPDWMNP